MRRRTELCCAWSGLPFVLLFFAGLLLLADFVPPPSPHHSAQQITEMYQAHANRIRAGLLIAFFGTTFFLFFGAAITTQISRIPGVSPSLRHVQVASISAASLIIIFPVMMWWTAAFRPYDRPPSEIRLITDLGWIIFVAGYVPYVTWAVAVGVAILCDPDDHPLFPRWAGYFSILVASIQIPPSLLVFFTTGPLAWNGLISWWVTMFDFFTWVVVMAILTVRAIGTSSADDGHPAANAENHTLSAASHDVLGQHR